MSHDHDPRRRNFLLGGRKPNVLIFGDHIGQASINACSMATRSGR